MSAPSKTALIKKLVDDLGNSDPHIRGVILTSIKDALPIKYYAPEETPMVVREFTSRMVIAFGTVVSAVKKLEGKMSPVETITLNTIDEIVIMKPVKDKYLIIVRGDKIANVGLIYLNLSKVAEELEKIL